MVRLPLHGVLRMVRAGDRDRRLCLRHRRFRARHPLRVGLHHLHAARRGLRRAALNLRAVARGDLLPPLQETAPHPRTVRHRRAREFRIPAAQYTLADGRGVPASAPRRARMACPTQAGVPRLMNRALPAALTGWLALAGLTGAPATWAEGAGAELTAADEARGRGDLPAGLGT